MRKTERSHVPLTVPTTIRPATGGEAPRSANTPAGERTHTGSPRKVRQFPLSAKPVHETVFPPAVSLHGRRVCCIFLYR